MWLSVQLLRRGVITPDQFCDAVETCFANRPPIGLLAVRKGKLKMSQLFEILGEQAFDRRQFGRVAMDRGYLNQLEIAELLYLQEEETQSVSERLVESGVISADQLSLERTSAQERCATDFKQSATASVAAPTVVAAGSEQTGCGS